MNLFDAIKAQEKRILRLLRRLEDGSAERPSERRSTLDELGDRWRSLVRIERESLHPLLRDGEEGRRLVESWQQDQDEIEAALEELESIDPEAVSFQTIAEHLSSLVRVYVREERRDALRRASEEIEGELAQRLGHELEHRPHA